ncbi:MAG TPA: 4'-phosphopantetheinyl transferase superfamily protein [Spirochaetia bacterium]|nr:4'-phosphopantetheinyl transferase superfamily protein [Spirochaetia bacterium]
MAQQGGITAGYDIKITFVTTEQIDASTRRVFHALLDDSERGHLRRLRSESGKTEYLSAHALLRIGLSSMRRVAPSAWRFKRDQFGRPRIAFPIIDDQPAFSLSHTGLLVGCAFAASGLVGFDLEKIDRFSADTPADADSAEMMDLVSSNAEREAWLSIESAPLRALRFYRLWTIKEALLKAAGRGLTLRPSAICIDMDNESLPIVRELPAELGEPAAWSVRNLYPTKRHIAAIAANSGRSGVPEIHREVMEANALSRMLNDLESGLS